MSYENDILALEKESLKLKEKALKLRELNVSIREKELELKDKKEALCHHRIFSSINDINKLKKFMEYHVFAVWDFMSLTKRLQRDLTCIDLPWVPPSNRKAARLINEIILGEETDISFKNAKDSNMSHYELYLESMNEIGASVDNIKNFVKKVNANNYDSLLSQYTNNAVKRFVNYTLNISLHGKTSQVLGAFFNGRESVIPEMFQELLDKWNIKEEEAPHFVFYLKRHIELDSEEHGPAAIELINDLVTLPEEKLLLLEESINAVNERILLWDALLLDINNM